MVVDFWTKGEGGKIEREGVNRTGKVERGKGKKRSEPGLSLT